MRTAARVDANQRKLVKYWRELGGSWQSTHQLPGALDGIAGMFGLDCRVEIKDGDKVPSARKLTKAEKAVFDGWKGRRPVVWQNEKDVFALYRSLYTKDSA